MDDAQLFQLRCWGQVIFRRAGFVVEVLPEKRRVKFDIEGEISKEDNLLQGLARSVRWLFGDDYDVEVRTKVWTWTEDGCQEK